MSGTITNALAAINSLQRQVAGHVLLYHSTFSVVPREIRQNLHNVTPQVLFEQLTWLQRHFDIVPVDTLFEEDADVVGKVAITFDDAYQSVFDEALPVIETLGVPATIYVNCASLTGKPFWRDKVRYLINQSLVADFVEHHRDFARTHQLTASNFYRVTKTPHVNSAEFDSIIDEYLAQKELRPDTMQYCVSDQGMLRDHSLVTYGNHTLHHYVLSSLNFEQQEHEIGENHRRLTQLPLKVSKIFSVPFGGDTDLNETTLHVLNKLGYRGFLYSRGAMNFGRVRHKQNFMGIPYRERYMVRPSFPGFQRQILRLWLKGCKAYWFG